MPYYGATYYATYNPYNYYGQGDMCASANGCRRMTSGGGGPVGTIIGLCCFCCIIAIVCAIIAKGQSEDGGGDDAYVQVVETHTEFIYTGPPIEFNQEGGWPYRQSADWCAE
jgi:hypothetical protein